ncbi:iron uptake porin [Trichocoleus desertorum AS-A10]|uniref:iron uptake porin n=1 Tax=Trichocoleus desertorum TaxID=1481672 RepID=UPI003297039F
MRRINWVAGGLGSLSLLAQFSLKAEAELPHSSNSSLDLAVDTLSPPLRLPSRVDIFNSAALAKAEIENGSTLLEFAHDPAIAPAKFTQSIAQLPSSFSNPTAPVADRLATDDSAMAQVNSVSELSDVQPTDWAYQALKSLVERYGVVTGYSDGTFRGQQALTRYEFAAVLNAVFVKVNDLITTNQTSDLDPEDIETLRQLQSTFSPALNDLRDRLADLDGRTSELEANQFSTTTKLQGQAIFAPTIGTQASLELVSRVRLDLLTTLQPDALLLTQLEMGNGRTDAIGEVHNRDQNLLGTTGLLADAGGVEYAEVTETPRIRKLYYTFRPQPNLAVSIGPKIVPSDFIDRNPFANNSGIDFSSGFFVNNPLIVQNQIDRFGGAGIALDWQLSDSWALRSLYAAADGDNPQQGGLFGDRNQGSVELEYSINSTSSVQLQYTSATLNDTQIEAAGINAHWALDRTVAVFGRYGFGSYQGFNSVLAQNLDLHPQTWALGVVFRNLVIPGSLAGAAVGQPFITSNLGDATQTNFELFYNLSINEHFSVTPTFMLVTNPNNNATNPDIWQSTLRTVFTF